MQLQYQSDTTLSSLQSGIRHSAILAIALALIHATAWSQQAKTSPDTPVTIQPGAPGHSNTVLPPAMGTAPLMKPTDADIAFMRGMIMHHGQAVEMTHLMAARSHNQDLLELGKRISISQTDEMAFMKRWLADRSIAESEHRGMDMAGMDHMDMPGMDMGAMPSMPGMLSPQQMAALRKATGPEFDHLFLTGMIQHHTGALTMVKQLFDTPGSLQDAVLFDFTSDVDNTQLAEVDIMRHMLEKEKQ